MPCGVIDFGDVTRTLRVCELAVAASIAYGHDLDDPIAAAAEIVRGFDAACPLDDAELEALPHLIAARAAIVAVGTEQQALLEPHNDYAQRVRAGDWAICETAAGVPTALAEAAFRLACGRDASRPRAARARRDVAAPGHRAGCGDRPLADRARSAHAGRRDRCARRGALPRDARAVGRRARDDPPRPRRLRARRPGGAGAAGRAGRARGSGRARASRPADSRCAWPGSRPRWRSGDQVAEGAVVGHLTEGGALPPHLHVQVAPAGLTALPGLATPALAAAWLALCPHPGPLLGLAVPPKRVGALLARRRAVIPQAQPLYYAEPPEMVRGIRQYLYDADARAYLDCVNNVAVRRPQPSARDGRRHAPAAAAQHELALPLPSMTRFAERLAALLPGPLERVFLVSTGLGGQRPRAATRARRDRARGRALHPRRLPRLDDRDLRGLDELRRQPAGRAVAARQRAPGDVTRHLSRPDPARASAMRGRATPSRCATRSRPWPSAGRAPAAFICEALYGNAGGIVLPDGYLQAAYGARARGRRSLHRRRGAGRLRAAGRAFLGLRAAGRRAGHRHDREGDGQRASGRGRDHDRGDRRRAARARAGSSHPSAAARSPARSVWRCST